MTRITILAEKGSYKGFICEDHSGYAEEGSDIVCAAVSVLTINTINSITELTGTEMDIETDEENAVIRAFFREKPSKEAGLFVQSLILGVKSIEQDPRYAEFVKLIFEEE